MNWMNIDQLTGKQQFVQLPPVNRHDILHNTVMRINNNNNNNIIIIIINIIIIIARQKCIACTSRYF